MKWFKTSKKVLGIFCTLSMMLSMSSYYIVTSQLPVSAAGQSEQDETVVDEETETTDERVEDEQRAEADSEQDEGVVETEATEKDAGVAEAEATSDANKQAETKQPAEKATAEKKKAQAEERKQPIASFFPDSTLASVIARQLKKADANELVSEVELGLIRNLTYNGQKGSKITNLEGMQYLKNLRGLELPWNSIVNLHTLSGLSELQKLNLTVNQVSDLTPLQNLKKLTTITMRNNHISDLGPLGQLNKVLKLDLSRNRIKHLDAVHNLTALKHLQVDFNTITNLTPLIGLNQLQLLDLNHNDLVDISPLNGLNSLKDLRIGASKKGGLEDKITDFSVLLSLPSLERLDIQGRGIDRISDELLMRLKGLKVEYSRITDLTRFLPLSNLDTLFLGGNELEDISLLKDAYFPNLRELELSSNHITDLTPLKTAQLPQIAIIVLSDQSNKNVDLLAHEPNLAIENIVKDADGQLIEPNKLTPAEFGRYESPNIIWSLPLPMREPERNVVHKWNTKVQIGNVLAPYSGTYQARVYEHFPVLFEVEGVTFGEPLDLVPDSLLTPPMDPIKDGYSFVGWFTNPNGGQQWDFASNRTPHKPLTLYARYVVNGYNVIFNNEGELSKPVTTTYGTLIGVPDEPTKIGYTFAGWYTAASEGREWNFAQDTMPASDITLYARYTVNSYDVIFNNEGELSKAVTTTYGALIDVPDEPTKVGYTFVGWYTAASEGREWDFAQDTMPANNLMLYARYAVNGYNVIFNNEGELSKPVTTMYGALIGVPDEPTKIGYTFAGWYTAASEGREWNFAEDTMPASDITLYARYTVNSYDVVFNNEGKLSERVTTTYGALIGVPDEPTKVGYTFVGWYTAATEGREWDFAKDVMPANNLMLYARYTVNSYSVTFNNEGILSESLSVVFGELIPEPDEPKKAGHKFTGWYRESEDGNQWNFGVDKMPAGDIILHARYEWQQEVAKWTITATSIRWNKTEFIKLQADKKLLEAALIEHSKVKVFDHNNECICDWSEGMFRVTNLNDLIAINAESDYEVHLAFVGPTLTAEFEPLLSTKVTLTVLATDTDDQGDGNDNNQDNGASNEVNNGGGGSENKTKLPQTGEHINEKLLFGMLLIFTSIVLILVVFIQKRLAKHNIDLKQLFK